MYIFLNLPLPLSVQPIYRILPTCTQVSISSCSYHLLSGEYWKRESLMYALGFKVSRFAALSGTYNMVPKILRSMPLQIGLMGLRLWGDLKSQKQKPRTIRRLFGPLHSLGEDCPSQGSGARCSYTFMVEWQRL